MLTSFWAGVALQIDVEDVGFHLVEIFIIAIPSFCTNITTVVKSTSSSNVIIFLFIDVSMIVEELILVNRHSIISRYVAFCWISARIANHNPLEVDGFAIGGRMFVVGDDFHG